ncbi:hypothetical protein TNCV_446931 [Trichonephila clavipes]|nr:hypothetical protein TNCV_446931 [Trichonephila clavipes]
MSEFGRIRLIGLQDSVWTNRRSARYLGQSDTVIRRYRLKVDINVRRAAVIRGLQLNGKTEQFLEQLSHHRICRYQNYPPCAPDTCPTRPSTDY